MTALSLRFNALLQHLGLRRTAATGPDWTPEIDTAFRADAWTRAHYKLCLMFAGAAILFLAFWLWDFRREPVAATHTLTLRLIAAILCLAISVAPSFSRVAKELMPALYPLGMAAAAVALMLIGILLPGGYSAVHGTIMLVVTAIAVLGPYDRFAAPLILVAAILPNALVAWMMAAGAALPGLPAADRMVEIALFQSGAAALAVALARLNTVERQALFLATRELERIATTDPLTGARNRHALAKHFAHEVARQRRARGSTALLMLDIDHFKQINDTHGREIGDEVLQDLVQRWSLALRDIDTLARVGGEEFVALLSDTVGLDALVIAERLRHETADMPVATSAGPVTVTVSLGVVVAGPDIDDLDLALERADAALIEAKSAGRDCVMVSTPLAYAA